MEENRDGLGNFSMDELGAMLEAWVEKARVFGKGRQLELLGKPLQRGEEDLTFLLGQCFVSLGTQHFSQSALA